VVEKEGDVIIKSHGKGNERGRATEDQPKMNQEQKRGVLKQRGAIEKELPAPTMPKQRNKKTAKQKIPGGSGVLVRKKRAEKTARYPEGVRVSFLQGTRREEGGSKTFYKRGPGVARSRLTPERSRGKKVIEKTGAAAKRSGQIL